MSSRDQRDSYAVQAPRHPVAQLQAPFEESMLESVHDDSDSDIFIDPILRRNTLLEAPTYTRVVAGRWKQKPGEKFHPLWKLIAQISFGIHLLAQGMAKSEDEVMQILQAHVDEIDGFLERTTEDFDLAQEDIQERLRCLKLPLSHPATFDRMLEDRNFRLSIVEGNEKIEHIVDRTTSAMKDSMKDVQKGFDSTGCLEEYLQGLNATWHRQSMEHEAVFVAMLGNVEGWRKAFMSLHLQGGKLNGSLKKLTDIINEMQARAGEVSRRLLHQARVQRPQVMGKPASIAGRNTPTPTSRFQSTPNKQLPIMPTRPPLRQTASHDTVRTSTRTTSQETLRQQALLGRSQTPQHDMPAPRQVNTGASPRIIQIGNNSQARVQSMVPSLLGTVPSPRATSTLVKEIPTVEEVQQERYFPPVELPAHVPEETMRAAPMSKQNRLSTGLGLIQANKAEKRNSKLGTTALIDLLRSTSITPKSKTPEISRRTSAVFSQSGVEDTSITTPAKQSTVSPHRSSSSDTTSQHTKNNVRRPKKGAQHWFDALDDDLFEEDDKMSAQESHPADSIPIGDSVSSHVPDISPGTPSWAVTSFKQAEQKKELLKKGAFNSHPPELPPGSPPLAQNMFPNPLGVAPIQRRPSHASSVGHSTLGEPGPEVMASEAGSTSGKAGLQGLESMKRASAYAPEVVIQKAPPVTTRTFIAEMEGSSPMMRVPPTTSRNIVMELEAPQQYFKLPPRSSATNTLQGTSPVVSAASTPPRSHTPLGETDDGQVTKASSQTLETPNDQPDPSPEPTEAIIQTKLVADKDEHTSSSTDSPKIVEQFATPLDTNTGELLSSKVYVATPSIPLPPSPLASETVSDTISEAEVTKKAPAKEDNLYILPAIAYRAPALSPRLPPSPVLPRQGALAIEESQVDEDARSTQSMVAEPPSTKPSPKPPVEEYDPFKADEAKPRSPALSTPRLNTTVSGITTTTIIRERKPENLKHVRNSSSHGSNNGWKAFFTGQPSPVGSNLSIRSVKRESAIPTQQSQSPTLLSPDSATTRHHFPASPGGNSLKDQLLSQKAFESGQRMSSGNESKQPQGLGIVTGLQ